MRKRIWMAILLITTLAYAVLQDDMIKICKTYGMPEEQAKRFTAELIDQCTLANINPMIMFNLAIAESGLKNIIGDGGDSVGYFQLHKNTITFLKSYYKLKDIPKDHKELVKNPNLQIKLAVLYMKYLLEKYKSLNAALERWNGSARFVRYYEQVAMYVERVYKLE